MKYNHLMCAAALTLLLHNVARAEQPTDGAFGVKASFFGDLAIVHSDKTHLGYLEYASLGGSFDTEKGNWWRGGKFLFSFANTFGAKPSENWIGDWQYANCNEAGSYTFVDELWYQHSFDKTTITAGVYDMNDYFNWCDATYYYINSSFTLTPTLSINYNVPTIPVNGLGLTIEHQPSDNVKFLAGAFDGYVVPLEDNEWNFNWRVNFHEGFLTMAELQITSDKSFIELGAHYHTGEDQLGAYLKGSTSLFDSDRHQLELFGQLGYLFPVSPCRANICAGVNFKGVFGDKDADTIGIGVTTVDIHGAEKHETAFEFLYKWSFAEYVYAQADFQYILHPTGNIGSSTPNAWMTTFRLALDF